MLNDSLNSSDDSLNELQVKLKTIDATIGSTINDIWDLKFGLKMYSASDSILDNVFEVIPKILHHLLKGIVKPERDSTECRMVILLMRN